MTNFMENNVFFVCLASAGVVIWITGLIVQNKQPKKINHIYGYRTKRSMKSQTAWDFAQDYSTKLLIQSAKLMCILAGISLFFQMSVVTGALFGTVLIILIILYPIISTEKALKEKFGDDW